MDNENLLSTPGNYATPSQIKSAYDYAKALMYGSGQQPAVRHWTQGVSNMVSALVGGNMDYQANKAERTRELFDAGQRNKLLGQSGAFGPSPQGATPLNFSEGPSSAGPDQTAGGTDQLSKAAAITSGQESGGNYGALGPVTKTGDRAYGKYQIMGANIGPWSAEATGRAYTPEEFLKDPQAQDATYKHKMSQYISQYGPEGAARAWLGGPGGINHPERTDQLGTSIGDYGHRFAMAFNGTPADASTGQPAADAITMALARGGRSTPAPAPGVPFPDPSGGNGQTYINPALIRPRTNFQPQALQNVFASGSAADTPEFKNSLFGMALQQGQPISIPYMGGAVLVDPRNPRVQQFMPSVEWKEIDVGGVKVPAAIIPNGRGGFISAPIMQGGAHGATAPAAGGPRSEAQTPTGAPQGQAAAQAPAPAQNAPQAPATAFAEEAKPEGGKPVQVASLEPNSGVQAAAQQGTPPALPANPKAPEQTTPLAKLAQAAPPTNILDQAFGLYRRKQEMDIQQKESEERNKQEIDHGMKAYDNFTTQSAAANDLLPRIEGSLSLLNDPRMHTGMLSGVQDIWSRFKASVLGEKDANAPNELFDKLAASQVLGTMRSTLQGLGQVRLAEINLLNRANASRFYGDPANRAVLEVSRTGLQKIAQLGQMANEYVGGRDVVDPTTGQVLLKAGEGKRHGLDSDFNTVAQKWTEAQNKIYAEKYKNYEKLFDTGRDPSGAKLWERGAGDAPPQHPEVGQPWTFKDKQGNPITGYWNGKGWQGQPVTAPPTSQ